MNPSNKLSTAVAAVLLVVSSSSFSQGAGAGAGAGSSGGPTAGSEAAINPSGATTPSGGTAAGGMTGQTSPSARRGVAPADMSPSQKAAARDKRVGAVMGSGTPSGVQPADGTSAGLPRDQQGRAMTPRSAAGTANAVPPGMTANSTVTGTPGSTPSTDAATADKGPVMGSGNGPSGTAPAPHTSKSKMPTP